MGFPYLCYDIYDMYASLLECEPSQKNSGCNTQNWDKWDMATKLVCKTRISWDAYGGGIVTAS